MLSRALTRPGTFLVGLALVALTLLPGATGPAPSPPVPVAASSAGTGFVPGEVLVKYRTGTSPQEMDRVQRALGAQAVSHVPGLGVRVLRVPSGAEDALVAALARNPSVQFAERNPLVIATGTPNDPWWPNEWGETKVRAPQAWEITTGSASVAVAVLDTGIDFGQPDLQGKIVAGRDIVNNDADPSDDNGHGTYTAGVVGAATNNGLGVAAYCWGCSIMPVKVLGADGSGSMSNVAAGITWATDHGARVISMSLGGTSSSSTLASAVKYAHDHGVVLVAAAGNYGTSSPVYPAAYPEVLGVAGTDPNDALYSWSSYGSWVSLAAPGCNVTTGRNAWYGTFCGTSSAAPVVAAIAGLAVSLAPSTTNAAVEAALESTAAPIGGSVAYGRVDALATLQAVGGSNTSLTASPTPSPTASPSPSPTPTPSPTASPSPTATPTPSPTPTASPTSTSTATYRGSLSRKTPERQYALTVGAGALAASVDFTGPPALTLTVRGPDGATVGSVSGGGVLTLTVTAAGGTYTCVVADDGSKANFRLTVQYPTP